MKIHAYSFFIAMPFRGVRITISAEIEDDDDDDVLK